MRPDKYFFTITSRAAGSFTIDLTKFQYDHLLTKFSLDLRLNEELYQNGKTNIHLGYRHKYEELHYCNKTIHTYMDEGVTYMLTNLEFK